MGMEGMLQPANNQAEESETTQEKETNPLDRLDNLARGMSLKDGSETWQSIKDEFESSGADYRKDSVEYGRAVTKLYDAALEKGDIDSLRKIVDIFGEDALTEERKNDLIAKGERAVDGGINSNKIERSVIEYGMDMLEIAGVTSGELAESVYKKLSDSGKLQDKYQELSSIIPGLKAALERRL